MRTKKWMRLAFLALVTSVILQSCSKDEVVIPQDDLTVSEAWTVRPDFATVDTRPQDVIAKFQITENNAVPAKLITNAAKGAKYAVVIGISDYEGTSNDLQYCDDDANDWTAQLQSEGYNVTTLLDLNATKSAIEAALTTLASQSIAGNEIAFIYSGHGSRGNIVTTDLYYINSAWFKTTFLNATSTKMMFSFDACQIGAMATDLNATGRVVAVASDTRRYSYDGDATMQNGVFTYYQMIGLDQLNYVYFEPDCQYACDQMAIWAKAVHVKVAPSYVDSYAGDLDI
jgi:hypothetical protein